jgi:hypothetical protein
MALLSGVGVDCRLYLLVVLNCCWLPGVGCQDADCVDCRMSLLSVSSWLSGVSCRLFVVECLLRLSLSFSIVGAQLCSMLLFFIFSVLLLN